MNNSTDNTSQMDKYNINLDQEEELFNPQNNRLTTHPIKFPKIWEMYKKQIACFWTVEEIDFSKDITDWDKLNEDEKYFIKNILAFFAASDGIVNINLGERFVEDVQITEAKYFYRFQEAMEDIHNNAYSLMIDTYIKNRIEKEKLLNGVNEIPCIKKKAEWAFKWIESDDEYAIRLIAFAIIEGVFFSGAFCSIFWLGERGLMPGLTFANELIARDEGLHTDFACLLFSMLKKRPNEQKVHNIFKEAVDIEKQFICDSLPCKLLGMNSDLMCQYIEFVADRLLLNLEYKKLFNVTNPFSFMERISAEGKTNFFEKRVSQYQKSSATKKNDDSQIKLIEDF